VRRKSLKLSSKQMHVMHGVARRGEGGVHAGAHHLAAGAATHGGGDRVREYVDVPSSGRCALCGEEEDMNHIFFSVLAKFMWSALRGWAGTLPASHTSIQCYNSARVKRKESSGLVVRRSAGPYGTRGTSFPSRGASHLILLTAYTKCQVWKPVARR
jgi:hypothetical protein